MKIMRVFWGNLHAGRGELIQLVALCRKAGVPHGVDG